MLKVIGAGLGRTGTESLKQALERLLDAPCYHMTEVFENLDHIPLWQQAVRGNEPDWHAMFTNYQGAVDWPAASFWPELSAAFPEALVVLSVRDPEEWYDSASRTIFIDHNPAPETDWQDMWLEVAATRFTVKFNNRQACIDAFNRHYDAVRKALPSERLLEWTVKDGWEPLCAALDLPLPDEPFPHSNRKEDFQKKLEEINQSIESGQDVS